MRRSRQPLEAASAESEGPQSPISRRERVCVSWGAGFFTFSPALCCDTTLILVGWTQASELPLDKEEFTFIRPGSLKISGLRAQAMEQFQAESDRRKLAGE